MGITSLTSRRKVRSFLAELYWQLSTSKQIITMADAFVGKFVVESKENYDAFMKGVGVPDEYINMSRDVKVITDISKSGNNLVVQRIRPQKTTSNTLTIGQECEIDTIKGDKVKITPTIEGGKIVCKGEIYNLIMEIDGGKLKEVITFKGHTMSRVSKKE